MARADVYDRLSSLADPTRSRLLLVLDRHELTVGELCAALQLPQSTVSRHLKQLGDMRWIVSRAEGASRLYRVVPRLDAAARKLWQVVREQVAESDTARRDAQRVTAILEKRRRASQDFFTSAAGQWDTLRAGLFGRRTDLIALLSLLDDSLVVGDLGCGTGALTEVLAPSVSRVIAVDASKAMLASARRRVGDAPNVELRQGALESLPIDAGALDVAILFLVLHYVPEPALALAEARRVLGPGGRLLVVDMMPHEQGDLRERMGHVWQGIGEGMLAEWMEDAGFGPMQYRALPVDETATGPALFAATARPRAVLGAQSADAGPARTRRAAERRSA